MEEKVKSEETTSTAGTTLYYGIGAAVLVLLVAGVYFMRPKAGSQPTVTPTSEQAGSTGASLVKPTGPIAGLACELQYYNPVIGFNKYYLSVEGTGLAPAKSVDCDFTMSVAGKVVGTAKVNDVALVDEPSRSGKTFRCSTSGTELEPNVPTVVDVKLTDDAKNTATCSATFLLPSP